MAWYVKRADKTLAHADNLGYNRVGKRSISLSSILSQVSDIKGEAQTDINKCATEVQNILVRNGINSSKAGEIAARGIDLFKSDNDVMTTNKRVGKLALPPEYMKMAIQQSLK